MSSPTKDRRKRRKKRSTSTKQMTCSGCSYIFKCTDELLQHKLDSQNVLCNADVHNCSNCGKSFLSAFGLEMHMMKSSKCYVAKNLPDIVSTIKFGSGVSTSISRNKENASYPHIMWLNYK